MRQEEFQLWRATSRAIEQSERQHLSGQWQRPFDIYLTKAPFPMPPPLSTNLATSPVYVQVEHVRRIDTQILRHYPDSYAEFPFYEVRARILNTWGG
ncbi:MAG: hypothetical protein RMJ83_05690 [Armatimonadota bacterium]|nr:hypothetical protein [Armatimonadota bacterium]